MLLLALEELGSGRMVMDDENPEEPFLDDDGYLAVRFRDPPDITGFARHLERKVRGLRVIEVVDPTRPDESPAVPGSARAQREAGLLGDGLT